MQDTTTIAAAQGITAAELGGEAVLLDAHSGRYYELNEVGFRIFELAQRPRTLRELLDALLAEYDVSEERLRTDVVAFVEAMRERGLVQVTSEVA